MGSSTPPPRSATGMSVIPVIVPAGLARSVQLAQYGADGPGELGRDVRDQQVGTAADHVAAADDHVGDVGGGGGEHGGLEGGAACPESRVLLDPCGPDGVQRYGDQISQGPGGDLAG